ncbi:MAG: hypothetical protein ACOX0Z_04090 [Candidatus Nanosyncoccaceae bacterium]|jgi:hypothetical protein
MKKFAGMLTTQERVVVGESIHGYGIFGGRMLLTYTSVVQRITPLESLDNVFKVETMNSIYIVHKDVPKRLRYNGGTQSLPQAGCTDPSDLVIGDTYKVSHEEVHDCYTNVYLVGHEGCYNSLWFDEVLHP